MYATHFSRGGAADVITWKVESSGDIFFGYILGSKHIPCHTVAAPWPALTHDQGQWGSSQAKHVALMGWCFESNEHGRYCIIVHVFITGDMIITLKCSPGPYDPSSHFSKVFLSKALGIWIERRHLPLGSLDTWETRNFLLPTSPDVPWLMEIQWSDAFTLLHMVVVWKCTTLCVRVRLVIYCIKECIITCNRQESHQ